MSTTSVRVEYGLVSYGAGLWLFRGAADGRMAIIPLSYVRDGKCSEEDFERGHSAFLRRERGEPMGSVYRAEHVDHNAVCSLGDIDKNGNCRKCGCRDTDHEASI